MRSCAGDPTEATASPAAAFPSKPSSPSWVTKRSSLLTGLTTGKQLSEEGSEEPPVATGEWSPVMGNARFAPRGQAGNCTANTGISLGGSHPPLALPKGFCRPEFALWFCLERAVSANAAHSAARAACFRALAKIVSPRRPVPPAWSQRSPSPSAGLSAPRYALPAALAVVLGVAALGALLTAPRCRRRNAEGEKRRAGRGAPGRNGRQRAVLHRGNGQAGQRGAWHGSIRIPIIPSPSWSFLGGGRVEGLFPKMGTHGSGWGFCLVWGCSAGFYFSCDTCKTC